MAICAGNCLGRNAQDGKLEVKAKSLETFEGKYGEGCAGTAMPIFCDGENLVGPPEHTTRVQDSLATASVVQGVIPPGGQTGDVQRSMTISAPSCRALRVHMQMAFGFDFNNVQPGAQPGFSYDRTFTIDAGPVFTVPGPTINNTFSLDYPAPAPPPGGAATGINVVYGGLERDFYFTIPAGRAVTATVITRAFNVGIAGLAAAGGRANPYARATSNATVVSGRASLRYIGSTA